MGPKLIWWTFYLRSMFVQIIEILHFLCHFIYVKSLKTPDARPDASFYALTASFDYVRLNVITIVIEKMFPKQKLHLNRVNLNCIVPKKGEYSLITVPRLMRSQVL